MNRNPIKRADALCAAAFSITLQPIHAAALRIGKSCGAAARLSALLAGAILVLSAQADPLDCWTRRLQQNGELYGTAFADGLWVTFGRDTILTSADGVHWDSRFVGADRETWDFAAVARGNGTFAALGLRVATNGVRTGFSSLATSGDGIFWTRRNSGVTSDLFAAAFGNGIFVAVGQTLLDFAGANRNMAILTSPDAVTWTDRITGLAGILSDVTFANGIFVAVGSDGTIFTSANGVNWSSQASQANGDLHGVTYGGGLFVAVGSFGRVMTSVDGTNWVNRSSGESSDLTSVAYGAGRFVASRDAYGSILSSTNGIDWRGHPIAFGSYGGVAYGAGNFISVNASGEIWQSASWLTGAPPSIALQPQDQTVYSGLSISLSVSPAGCSVPSFQWSKDGLPVAGATSSVLTAGSASFSDSGNYSVVLTDMFGSITSRVARLEVVSAPLQLTLQGWWPGFERTNGFAEAVRVVGNYAYLADGPAGLRVIDVSDPGNPVQVDQYNTGHWAQDVELAGTNACVTDLDTGLHILEISNPAHPVLRQRIDTGVCAESPNGLQVVGNLAYILDGAGNLQVVSFNDPTHPARVESILVSSGYAAGVQVSGNRVYLAGARETIEENDVGFLQVLDLAQPTNPVPTGFTDTITLGYGVAVAGPFAYMVGECPAMTVVNVSNPTNPAIMGTFTGSGRAVSVQVVDQYAFIAGPSLGLLVLDISNPANPVRVAQYPFVDGTDDGWDVHVVGNHAYVANGYSGLRILEINELPRIKGITRSGNQLMLWWNGAPGLRLQRSTSVTGSEWSDVPDSEGWSLVELPLGSSNEFFRLLRP